MAIVLSVAYFFCRELFLEGCDLWGPPLLGFPRGLEPRHRSFDG